ncbi:MAG: hypothetical protein EA341_08710 [Mongoliibacter sp.]|jgi:hypothetical protein|uniref:hypothetical protein n=1 Tax=Mongoliibacter sp. TaxID=2022438 RepID=UPI0012F14908|nr:hypothetical protein [Mongoliibacter sp.]TVP49877.1 MAG: hypothetical protein EA341_08710 [Mongoliibacter sp.]
MKGIKYTAVLFFFLVSGVVLGQRSDSGDYEYDTEILVGVNKNTNGGLIGGFSFKYGMRIDEMNFQFFGLDLANVKNPKEVRYNTVLGNSYIFGKSNYLYSIRPYYGRELILFKKAPQQGVQVSVLGAVGPTLGIIAPYFIEYSVSRVETVREQFNPAVHQSPLSILGPGRIFEGISRSEVAAGANAKAAVNFEFGAFKSNVTGLELGYQLEGFTREIPLMPTVENRQIFQSVYFTFFYGFRK